ncbi:hypothetical protein, partial [Streptomyces sp. TRM68416]|uniref:hypothetical protein n=1 Tax=Streptomyces sp. TRM68416 TaxID=2758412 RepID=UPI001CB706EF
MQEPHVRSGTPARHLPDRLCAVGPGWHPLLLRLHERLLAVETDYRIEDLKEKLGEVRVHVTTPSATARSEMRGLITEAEKQSATICDFCGEPGRRRRRNDGAAGWIKTVCDSCHAAWSQHTILIINGVVRHRLPRSL